MIAVTVVLFDALIFVCVYWAEDIYIYIWMDLVLFLMTAALLSTSNMKVYSSLYLVDFLLDL